MKAARILQISLKERENYAKMDPKVKATRALKKKLLKRDDYQKMDPKDKAEMLSKQREKKDNIDPKDKAEMLSKKREYYRENYEKGREEQTEKLNAAIRARLANMNSDQPILHKKSPELYAAIREGLGDEESVLLRVILQAAVPEFLRKINMTFLSEGAMKVYGEYYRWMTRLQLHVGSNMIIFFSRIICQYLST